MPSAIAPPRSLVQAIYRLNPAVDIEVDVLAVVRAAGASTKEDWTAATLASTAVDAKGLVRLAEAGSRDLFASGGTVATSTTHYSPAGSSRGSETYWLDFWPDPAVVGPHGFTLHSLDLVLGRKDGSVVFSDVGPWGNYGTGARFQITVARLDERWNREVLGDVVDIPAADVTLAGGLVSLNFRAKDRTIVIKTGQHRTRTGTGRTGAGAERVVDWTIEGDKKISHLVVPMGFSIGIRPVGGASTTQIGAWVGVRDGADVEFDPTTFWRSSSGNARDMGPYSPDVDGFSPMATNNNPGYGHLETGAVPGYGAIPTQAVDGSARPYGSWGVSREVAERDGYQVSAEPGWRYPYHVVRGVTYAPTGTVTRTFDLGAAPTNDVHFRADAAEPTGTSVTYVVSGSPDNVAWTSYGAQVDGAVFTGAQRVRYYRLVATLTASPDALATPALQAAFFTERIPYATRRYAEEIDSTSKIDPVTGQSEIGELALSLLRLGPNDGRDLPTTIATAHAPTSIEAWVYLRETITGRRHFLNLYRLEDRDPSLGVEQFKFLSGMDRLKTFVPPIAIGYVYPPDGSAGTITASTLAGLVCTITVAGTPFTGLNIIGHRYEGLTGPLAGTNWVVATTPAPTASTFAITLEDAAQQPLVGNTFRLHSDTTTRPEVVYAGVDFAAVYADILANLAAVPQRYRGALPPTTGRLTTGRLTEGKEALAPLQDIALHCGGAMAWIKGRISYVDLYGAKDVVERWSEQDYVTLAPGIGAARRMPSIAVKYGYDYGAGRFGNEITFTDEDALLGWGRANLTPAALPDEFCKWNDAAEARFQGLRMTKAWSTGVRLWPVTLAIPRPWVELGDAVAISTDVYTDRRILFDDAGLLDVGTPVTGRVTAVGVVVGKNLWGTDFVVAVRGLDAISSAPVSSTGTIEGAGLPLACPAITLTAVTSSASLFATLNIAVTFPVPASPYFREVELAVSTDGGPARVAATSTNGTARIGAMWGATYTVTPTVITLAGIRTTGAPVTINPGSVGPTIARRVPMLNDAGASDGYAAKAADTAGRTLASDVQQSDGAAPRAIAKGHIAGTVRHGDVVSYPVPFAAPPFVAFGYGAVVYEPRAKWGTAAQVDAGTAATAWVTTAPHGVEVVALNASASGFTARARLVQEAAALTTRENDFPAGNSLTTAGATTEATTTNAPAADETYKVRGTISVTAQGASVGVVSTATLVVAVDSSADSGATWVERERRTYAVTAPVNGTKTTTWTGELFTLVLGGASAMDGTDKVRFRVVSFTQTDPTDFGSFTVHGYNKVTDANPFAGVTHTTSAGNVYASATPTASTLIPYDAIATS